MRKGIVCGAMVALVVSYASAAIASELPRRSFLGLRLDPIPDGKGLRVSEVVPGGTGESAALKAGDVLLAVNGKPAASPSDVASLAGNLDSGSTVRFDLVRSGQFVKASAKATPRPMETYSGATVDYGAVQFGGSQLRDVLVLPAKAKSPPVVFYLQGYSCGSIEWTGGNTFFHRLGEELLRHGLGYYRVEKAGMGDSRGPLRCEDVDFATELRGFRAAYQHLIEDLGIAPDRIFLFGHSMGGIQAPFLAEERAPRGVAVYGTVVRNWADYHRDLSATQDFLIDGQDPAENARKAEAYRDVFRHFYFDKMTPAAIAAAGPDAATALRDNFAWDGKNEMFGRSYKFAQDLASLSLLDHWKKSQTNVLAIYGGSDMVALTDIDHHYLVDIANYWRPGSGSYVEIPGTDHGMKVVGSRAAVREAHRTGKSVSEGPFNPKVVDALADWIAASMAKPPIAPHG